MKHRWHFPNTPAAVGAARRCVEDALAGAPKRLVETASLLVSELATNAVCHAGTAFDVGIDLGSCSVRVEVHDTGPGDPVRRTPSLAEANGRGLQIVDLLADEWGVVHHGGASKATWFTLEATGTRSARQPHPAGNPA